MLARSGDAAVPALAAALDSPVPQRRHRAVAALSKTGTPGAVAVLDGAAGHPDPVVRGRVALVRGAHGAVDAVPALVELVVDGRDDVAAADVLGDLASRYGQADVVADAVLAALVDDPDRGVALTATHLVRSRAQRT